MSGNTNKIIAFNYFGGKFSWLDNIYKNFPEDFTHLIEVFGGSLAVSLNYRKECIKTANEINSEVTNFFQVLRDHEPELIRLLLLTPCSNLEYDNCWLKTDDHIENARRFYVRVRQSFFGLGCSRKNKGWHFAKQNGDTRGGETVSKWFNALEKLHEVAEVLRNNFQITNCDYKDILDKADFPKAFFYLDPPYSKRSRKSYNDYAFEFSDEDHFELASKLAEIKGKAMISGYDCSLMNDLYKDWRKVKFPIKKNNIRSGEVQEVIWMNYDKQTEDLFTTNY
ncbi:DNA adenine methylase [Flavobacterium sp. F-380]|uniref:DNA adenine methylase n=1 Tax=Flavobacterium kayseriense TaxID=2764714 RepID=A0ABR7J5L2_9FLAO|nr:DNA adenine methylase [Flavobacterium kayseriense]MBC5840777.1 DNA adenine methylase [Flavobacterium kayseriense]MBC5846553.1 DNA adenine methylase [Flavobacterium kayseriense]